MTLKVLDASQVTVVVGTTPIQGFVKDGDAVKIEMDEPSYKIVKGLYGEVTRYLIGDNVATITLNINESSPSNALLLNLQDLDRQAGGGVFPLQITDITQDKIFFAAEAFVNTKLSDRFGGDTNSREWTITAIAPTYHIGD